MRAESLIHSSEIWQPVGFNLLRLFRRSLLALKCRERVTNELNLIFYENLLFIKTTVKSSNYTNIYLSTHRNIPKDESEFLYLVTNFFAYLQIWLEFWVLVVCNVICYLGSLRSSVETELISLLSPCLQCLHLLRLILVTICLPVHITQYPRRFESPSTILSNFSALLFWFLPSHSV